MKTGDAIATVTQPIARAIDWTLGTNLRNCPGCHQMQLNLNTGMSLADAFYDRFWKTRDQKENITMQYIVNKTQTEQIAIDANDPKEALAKVKNGEGQLTATNETFNVQPRPQPVPR